MQTRTLFPRSAWLFLLLSISFFPSFGQSSNSSLNYGFVSPNTREGLKLNDAISGLNSTEEANLIRRVAHLRCVARNPIQISRAIGSWSDGAEHSLLIRVKGDESTMRYMMSRVGRTANQKAVLYFHPHSEGAARIYIIHPSKRFRSVAVISRLLDSNGVAFRTLVPAKSETTVYVIDTDNALSAKIRKASKRLKGKFSTLAGDANFLGDDSVREKGQEIFQKEIADYESIHPNLSATCKNN